MDCQTVRTTIHVAPLDSALQAHLAMCVRCISYAERMARLDAALRSELVVAAPALLTNRLHNVAVAPANRLDAALRDELIAPVPVALTARLLDLVPQPARVVSPLDAALKEVLVVQAPPALTARLHALVPQAVAAVQPLATPARPRRWVIATVYLVTSALLLFSLMYAGQIYSLAIAQLGLEQWMAQIAALPADLLERLYTLIPQSRVVIGTIVRLQQPLQYMLVALILWAVIDMTQRDASNMLQRVGFLGQPTQQ